MLRGTKIGIRLLIGFALIFVICISTTFFASTRLKLLSENTLELYEHPLTVSNAALRISANITRLYRTMKDIVAASNLSQVSEEVQMVDKYEREIFKDFELIDERFLGDRVLYEKASGFFDQSERNRAKVFELMREGKRAEADQLVKRLEKGFLVSLEQSIEALEQFAQKKAKEFVSKNHQVRDEAFFLLYLSIAAAFFLCGVLSYFLARSIVRPILYLKDSAEQLGKGNLNAHIDQSVCTGEFGSLAESFNSMAKDLKMSREKLVSEKAYLDSVLSAAGESVIVINTEGIVEEFNHAAEVTFGYRASEIIGKNVHVLMPSPYQEHHDEYLECYARTGKAKIIGKGYQEVEGLRKSGEKFPLDITVTEVALSDVNRKVFVSIVRDISARKKTEEEINDLARFPSQNPHPTLRLDRKGKILFANRASMGLLSAWDRQVGDTVRDYWRKIVAEVLETGKSKEVEAACDESIFSLTFVPFSELEYVNIYGLDVTERKKANSELKESEARVGSIVKAAVDGIVTVNEQGIVQLFNPAATKILGYQEDEVIGKSVRMLMPPTIERNEYENYVANYVRAGEEKIIGSSQEVSGAHKNGSIIPLDLSLSEMIMANGQRLFIGIIRDITDRKRAEAEIEKAMAAKDDFTSMVSHELRTPLAISKEALSLILRRKVGEIQPQQEEIITMASTNIDRLGYLINDILDATKVSAGKMTLNKEMINVLELVKENLEGWKLKAETKHIELVMDAPDHPLVMFVDRVRFMQILSNLISNALKFTPEFGRIDVTIEELANAVKFVVKDTGIGISEEDMPKIFQKFQQLQRTFGPGIQGTGLGLNITKSLVELHDGQIFVDSKLGTGTTFAFTIPKNQKQEEENDE